MANMLRGSFRGKLISWKDDKGFGFIQPEDGSKEIFLHISALDATRRPKSGDIIYYDLAPGQRGKVQAVNARIEGVPFATPEPSPSSSTTHSAKIFGWLAVSGAFLFCFISAMYHPMFGINALFVAAYTVLNLLTFAMYWIDKDAAMRQRWRIPEMTLHGLEFLGGWFGGFIAQQVLRHKTVKASYQFLFWSIVTLHVGFWSWMLFQ
jgi:uncharacterized membrane protein YsdA (DUF1294 family)/cold shock CspA family protein